MVQQFFESSQLQADGQNFHGLFQLLYRGQAGGDSQMVILGVIAVGVGGTGGGQSHTGLLAQLPGTDGGAGHGVQTDEITALGIDPFSNTGRLDFLVQPA